MKTPRRLATVLLAASFIALPAASDPPGNYSITTEYLVASYFDFKDGIGFYDSGDPTNTFSYCVYKLFGARAVQPASGTWEIDQNMGTNINGPAIGISDLGIGGKPGGIDTTIPCPDFIGGTDANIFITFSGMNWRSYEHDSFTSLTLCSQYSFSSSSPGCLAIPTDARLYTSACDWDDAVFGADYTDAKGKYLFGEPWDTLLMKSDQLKCGLNNDLWFKTVDWSDTIQDFTAGGAGQTFDIIKNENAVPFGSGHSYMAVCWDVYYYNWSSGVPVLQRALTHDWKLILDLETLLDPTKIGQTTGALARHYGGAEPGDQDIGGLATALRGFYSQDAGNPKNDDFKGKGLGFGQNGFPCPDPDQHHTAKAKKPTPII